jgi:hypothetical protein
MRTYIEHIKKNWSKALHDKTSRSNLIGGIIALVFLAIFTYYFFDYIENRSGGVVMNDLILRLIPARDVSIPIVFFEVTVIILFIVRSTTDPAMLITFLLAYILILISRNITIGITELRPPTGLIELKDPIAALIYKSKSINRDLFYSGHTSLLFLFYLCANKKADKYYILIAAISVGILLLIQHVHYTIDIVCAPFFAYGCYWLSKKIPQYSQGITLVKVKV